MLNATETPVGTGPAPETDLIRQQIRGSSLLLVGRLLSLGINFVSQILIVHYLSTQNYGAWAYALSIVAFCQAFASLGLNRSIPRFIPIYQEREEYDYLFGTILLVLIIIAIMGLAIVGGFYAFPHALGHLINASDQRPVPLLFIMIFLVPVQAADGILMALFACFASPRAIFYRKYLLAPGLQLIAVALLITSKSTTLFLAYGYLAASVLGIIIYVWVLIRHMQLKGLLKHLDFKTITVPAKEIFAFTIPLMTTDLVIGVIQATDALLLGYFCNLSEVAIYRVVLPLAALNKLAMTAFAILYTPIAARLFAKGDSEGVKALYWRTAIWMAAITFPIFAVTFALADPLTVFLYGERYARSGIVLTLLSLGFYFNGALGFNDLTIQVFGKLRYIVATNLIAAACNVALNLQLIPRYGALGAAIGTTVTLIVLNLFLQAGLRIVLGFKMFERQYALFYGVIGAATAGLFFITVLRPVQIYVSVPLTIVLTLSVLALAKRSLKFEETFPELVRLPLMRLIFT